MRQVVEAANALGRFDAVIHNAAVGSSESRPIMTSDGMSHVFAVNVLAPYLLTSEIEMPRRLVYLSSGMHRGGNARLDDLQWERRRWSGPQAYSDSKLFVAVLAAAVARRYPDVLSNAVDPGWVATKMGGPGAPDDLAQGSVTQAWLAVSDDPMPLCQAPSSITSTGARRTAPCTTTGSKTSCSRLAPGSVGRAARRGAGRLNGFAARATSQVRTTSIVDRVGSAAYATRTP